MTIERTVDENGAITDTITLTPEENNAMDEAHQIVLQRYSQMGVTQTDWEKRMLECVFQGLIRFEGVDAMLHYAKTARISDGKQSVPRGYC